MTLREAIASYLVPGCTHRPAIRAEPIEWGGKIPTSVLGPPGVLLHTMAFDRRDTEGVHWEIGESIMGPNNPYRDAYYMGRARSTTEAEKMLLSVGYNPEAPYWRPE